MTSSGRLCMLSGVLLVLVAFAIHRAIFVPPPGSWGTAGGIMFALAAGGFVLVGFGLDQWGRAIAARLRSSGHD